MVVTTWQQSMLVGSALFQCSAIMENTSGEYKSVVTFQGLSVTQCCCASNRATVNVDVEEGFWFNFQLCLFFYISWFFFHFYLSPGLSGKCSQSEWKGAKQKQLSAGKRSKKRIKRRRRREKPITERTITSLWSRNKPGPDPIRNFLASITSMLEMKDSDGLQMVNDLTQPKQNASISIETKLSLWMFQ